MRKKVIPWLVGVFALLFVFAGIMIARELVGQKKTADEFNELAMLVTPEVTPKPTGDHDRTQQPEAGAQAPQPLPAVRNLQPLFERNGDCIGWLYIEDTAVNYPVMHTPESPERYLHKNFDKKYSAAGVPFLEGDCALNDDNLIIYGHNMKNGSMFATVTKYKKRDYWEAHPTVEFETADGVKQFAIFAAVRLKMDDSWYSFHIAGTEEEFTKQIDRIKKKALYDTGITPAYGTQLLTLSTCYGADKDDRILIIAAEIN